MGIFGKLFTKEKEYPTLDSNSPAAKKLDEIREPLGSWAKTISHPIEVVPAEKAAYMFIGEPPEQFGLAWIEDGKLSLLKKVVEEKKIPLAHFQALSNKLREAYEQSASVSRFSTTIANKKIIVTPSESLSQGVAAVVREVVAG